MPIEELYEDVLMNIELPVIGVYQEYPELLDFQVDEALSALMSGYMAEEQGKEIAPVRVQGLALLVFEAVRGNTERMLGRPRACLHCCRTAFSPWKSPLIRPERKALNAVECPVAPSGVYPGVNPVAKLILQGT